MPKKAVSPVIAVVLLIAITIAIGGVVSSWIRSFVDEGTHTSTCAITTAYTVQEAHYNASDGMIKLKIKNNGKGDIYNFTVEADNGTLTESIPASSPASSYRLGPGKTQYILANSSEHNITNIEKISLLVGSCANYAPAQVEVVNI